jgi:hypothetical protein
MSSYEAACHWVGGLGFRSFAGIIIVILAIVAAGVLGVLPHSVPVFFNAFLSGIAFTLCAGVVAFGGSRVNAAYYTAAALVAGGLITSIPSLFVVDSPVSWGTTLSRLGLAIGIMRGCHDLYVKYKEEKAKEE